MAWTPTNAVINSRAIAENLLTYFEANQVEALTWANGSAMKPIARFENSRATLNVPMYPAILFSDDNEQTDFGNDILTSAYTCLFLVMVTDPVPATAVLNARSYAEAIVSMIANIPHATIVTGTGATTGSIVLQDVQVGFDQIRTNEQGNEWMQQFEIRATYTLNAEGFE